MKTTSATPTTTDVDYLQQVLDLALTNSAFRKGLVTDPAGTIDRFSKTLGFDSRKLSPAALDVLGSLTQAELDTMAQLCQKSKDNGIPTLTFPL